VKRSETSGTIPKTNPTPAKGWRNFPTHDVPVALVTGFLGRSAYQECRCAPLRALVWHILPVLDCSISIANESGSSARKTFRFPPPADCFTSGERVRRACALVSQTLE
jgi:hypothetical protein